MMCGLNNYVFPVKDKMNSTEDMETDDLVKVISKGSKADYVCYSIIICIAVGKIGKI